MAHKQGFFAIGYIENRKTYISDLVKSTRIGRIDLNKLDEHVDNVWSNRYANVICYGQDYSIVDAHSNRISYILVNTGFSCPDSGDAIYGGFRSNIGPTDLSTSSGKWVGVTIGTQDSILKWFSKTPFEEFTSISRSGYAQLSLFLNNLSDRNLSHEECRKLLNDSFVAAQASNKIIIYPNSTKDKNATAYFPLDGCHGKNGSELFIKMNRHNDYPNGSTPWFGAYIVSRDEIIETIFESNGIHIGSLVFPSFYEANRFLNELANKAMKENWQWANTAEDRDKKSPFNLPILKSYVEFTYYRLQDEDAQASTEAQKKICKFGGKAYFNSGLLDRYFRQIFIVGEIDQQTIYFPAIGEHSREILKNARIYSDNEDVIARNFRKDDLPKIANYFTRREDVIFNASLDINFNDNHIFEDGVMRGRLPKYAGAYSACNDNKDEIEALASRICRDFESACDRAKLMAERNYKLAVPQFWKETGEIQFLLPIYLGEREEAEKPQCALALSLKKEGRYPYYRGETILTLDMAYNNARLLAKPDVFWLNDLV